MPKIAYIEKRFSKSSLKTIANANKIITEYTSAGFVLTLRQLYYQFVSRDLIENKQTEYKRLGSIINDAKLAGLIDWSAMEDRTRNLEKQPAWDSAADIADSAASSFHINRWLTQDYYPEVWVEKEALVGVIEGICEELDLPYFACRGYVSGSEGFNAGVRMAQAVRSKRTPIVFHLGDHDPSGLDMTRDNTERVRMFSGEYVKVVRLALNRDQIDEYNPPPNPAKETDARFEGYQLEHGDSSWELDALEPRVIANLIRENVEELIDWDRWNDVVEREEDGKKRLRDFAEQVRNEE